MNLKSAQIISTGPFPAQRFGWTPPLSHEASWTNESNNVIHIWITQVWLGMDIGGKGDFWFRLSRKSDGSLLGHTNYDHYRDPTGLHNYIMSYAPNTMDIEPKDGLILSYGCRRWNPVWPPTMRGDLAVTIWFST